jgi:hypothetical protein
MNITAHMLSCPEREAIRQQTLARLLATDWDAAPRVEIDGTTFARRQERIDHTTRLLLRSAIAASPDFILLLEDDLDFNRHLRHNLEHWHPLRQVAPGGYFFGSLYNPLVGQVSRRPDLAYFVADPNTVYGGQAVVFSLATARYLEAHWTDEIGMPDIKMPRVAARLSPVHYHVPSLVQHVGAISVWGGRFHAARDFDAGWRAKTIEPALAGG